MFILVAVDLLQQDAFGSFCHKSPCLLLRDDLDLLETHELITFLAARLAHAKGELLSDLADSEYLPRFSKLF